MKNYLILILFCSVLVSCEKSTFNENESIPKNNFKCVNGILIFDDYNSLFSYENNANTLSFFELTKIEKSMNFESQKSIFERIAMKEYELQIKPFESKTDEEMRGIPFPGHSPEYQNAIDKGIIKEVVEIDGSSYIDYNLADRGMAAYLNKDGLVMIGSTLFYAKGNTLKCLDNVDLSNIPKSINSTETNFNGNLRLATYTASAASGWVTSGRCRASVAVTYIIIAYGNINGGNFSNEIQGYPITINTNSQKKNFWGNWNQYWGQEEISGTASIDLWWSQSVTGPTNILYDFTKNYTIYKYLPSASNATIKYHPFTGENVASNFNFAVITAPYNGLYWWGTKPIAFYITARLPGGDNGITCSVGW